MSVDGFALLLACVAALLTLLGLRADRPIGVALATVGRMLVTTGVFLRYLAEGVRRRIRGERDLGPELVRRAFEDLGPTYLKLAQLVASSHGLFPEAYCVEFKKTLDRVRPFPFADVRRILGEELGRGALTAFASVDPTPLASASIAQVHAATLPDGRQVVLKIQRPHIARRIAADVRILRVAAILLSTVPMLELANPRAIIDDFARTLGEELDFQLEAAHMDEFNRIMAELGQKSARAPRVEHGLTTRRLITMERFYGVRVDDVAAIRARHIDPESKLITGLHAWFQSMIIYGFFHGDVHAGNLMLLDDESLGFLDFGIIGRFSPRIRMQITEYILAFAAGQYRKLGEVLLSMDAVAAGVDLDAMAADLERAYAPMLNLSFADINYGQILPDIIRVSVKHHMRLPREFVLVTKQMLYFDRYAKLLAPQLNIFSDPRLMAAVGEDVLRARAQAPQPS